MTDQPTEATGEALAAMRRFVNAAYEKKDAFGDLELALAALGAIGPVNPDTVQIAKLGKFIERNEAQLLLKDAARMLAESEQKRTLMTDAFQKLLETLREAFASGGVPNEDLIDAIELAAEVVKSCQ